MSGILRKRHPVLENANFDDLLIIGYQSQLFRDDEKAKFIDQGRHLIGWMGDESLKIDRYDVRATLSDLTPYEAPPGGYENRLDYLSPAEQKAEQLCEEERYYSLFTNEIEEEAYMEEIAKRQKAGYGQVAFNYDGNGGAPNGDSSTQTNEQQPIGPEVEEQEPDDPFEPLPNFDIPRHIDVPETMRLNAIIEKTARFIAAQGVQMEILIKAKQSNNPQFDFLNMNGRCNAYYKFIVNAMKEGKYPDRPPKPVVEKPASKDGEKQKQKKHQKESEEAPKVSVLSTIKYVPSEDCAYTQLISKIQGKRISEIKPSTPEPSEDSQELKEKVSVAKPIVDFKHKSNSVEVKKISSGLMLAQCYNSDSNDEEDGSDTGGDESSRDNTENDKDTNGKTKNTNPSSAPPLVEKSHLEKFDLPVPPEELQTIVDKTAAYVAKNGKDFEDILRTKKDARFEFLEDSSPYHRYYIYKVTGTIYLPATGSPAKNGNGVGINGTSKMLEESKSKVPPVPQPVSFTIRPQKKDEVATEVSTVKLNDSSGEEGEKAEKVDDDDESLSVAELLEREEKKEIRRVEERVKDKLATAAKLSLVSKEKQLQMERKKKAMAFLMQIKNKNGEPGVESMSSTPVTGATSAKTTIVEIGLVEEDMAKNNPIQIVDLDKEKSRSRSRLSRSRSPSPSHHRRERRRSRSRSSSKGKSKKSSRKRSGDREKRSDRSSRSKKSRHRRRSRSSSSSESSRSRRTKVERSKYR